MKKLLLNTLMLIAPMFLMAQASVVGDWKLEVPGEDGQLYASKLSFDAEGNYTLDFAMDGTINVRGKYEVDGSRITLWDVGGEFGCPSEMKGVYEFEVTDTAMRASVVKDDCAGRRGSGKVAFTRL
jgi:hypothetical protein